MTQGLAAQWEFRHLPQLALGGHCTGIEAVRHRRQRLGLKCANYVVGAVGASFTLDSGMSPGQVAGYVSASIPGR